MQLKLIVLAVRFACNEIDLKYRQRIAIEEFTKGQQSDTLAS